MEKVGIPHELADIIRQYMEKAGAKRIPRDLADALKR